jgi:hypothetical protein
VIAGLGNVFKSEVAFACGLNPFRKVATLTPDQLAALVTTARKFLLANVAETSGHHRTTGRIDHEESLWVYGRAGQPCRRCATPIRSQKHTADARISFWCPVCHSTLLERLTVRKSGLCGLLVFSAALAPVVYAQKSYVPPAGKWERKAPAELGLDAEKLKAAVDYALANGSTWDFERDQVRTFGAVLGPLPKQRAATNGIIIRHGYIAAEFGDIHTNDPVYSVAKSFISTVCSVAVERGLIKDVNDSVAKYIHDGGYDSPHNARITWKNHLQQESEWEGTMWGKNADFVGVEQFGNGQRKPRAIQDPGTFYEYNDVRSTAFRCLCSASSAKACPKC